MGSQNYAPSEGMRRSGLKTIYAMREGEETGLNWSHIIVVGPHEPPFVVDHEGRDLGEVGLGVAPYTCWFQRLPKVCV